MLASVSVVMAHCVHVWVERFPDSKNILSLEYFSCVMDQLTRFTVPLFLFLSGYGLTLQFQKKRLPLKQYYKFRMFKIMAPFILFSFLACFRHISHFAAYNWNTEFWTSTGAVLNMLFLKGFDYQFYFLIVIFQFYLIYPFVYRLRFSKTVLLLSLAVHMLFMSPVEAYLGLFGLSIPPVHYNALVFYWLYCFTGMYVAANHEKLTALAARYSPAKVLAAWCGIFAFMNFEFAWGVIAQGKPIEYVDHFNRWSVVLFCMFSLLLYEKFRNAFFENIYSRNWAKSIFTHVAPYTFFVYLFHTHVLRLIENSLPAVTLADMLTRTALVVALSYISAWFVHWVFEEFSGVLFFFALPHKKRFNRKGLPVFSYIYLLMLRQYSKSLRKYLNTAFKHPLLNKTALLVTTLLMMVKLPRAYLMQNRVK